MGCVMGVIWGHWAHGTVGYDMCDQTQAVTLSPFIVASHANTSEHRTAPHNIYIFMVGHTGIDFDLPHLDLNDLLARQELAPTKCVSLIDWESNWAITCHDLRESLGFS